MIEHFDQVTIVVRDVEKAKKFFGLLGFKDAILVVISGEEMSRYTGIGGIEAEHVTLELLEWH